MARTVSFLAILMLWLGLVPGGVAAADTHPHFAPGAPGVGDPYFPLSGNGGYDVQHYLLDLTFDPSSGEMVGEAVIIARATQNLSRFNLDFDGLEVLTVAVNGRNARWSREDGELTISPPRGVRNRNLFVAVIRYHGVPEALDDPTLGVSGFSHTEDGAIAVGQPHGASTWFPVNGHPIDKASFTFHLRVPEGMEAVANGVLERRHTANGTTTWTWVAREPMASYLATIAIDEYALDAYRDSGIRFWDAIDEDLFVPPQPRTGEQFAISQAADLTYKRLTRTISVPDDGATMSFWVDRNTEPEWDFFFVEAHTVGEEDWTTLPDANDHTTQNTGFVCPFWLELHPFLAHYQTDAGDGPCSPVGTTGAWWAASGASDGYEQWVIDLDAYAGTEVEVSLTYASDDVFQVRGVVVDDIEVSTGEGNTSFEADDDPLDGWLVPGSPEGSEPNANDWIAGTVADVGPTLGETADQTLARQPEIIAFLSDIFGPYPFAASGAIVTDFPLGYALETQTRPVYDPLFFTDPVFATSVVVHELAHQWVGDSLTVEEWQHIWLNEGFATYTEWLWSEQEGLETAQEIFEGHAFIPADDPFWELVIGDPGPENLFAGPVYARGALTLHALRLEVGDDAFFRILRQWAQTQTGGHVTTDEFIRLAEKVSRQQLDDLFETWLFTSGKPKGFEPPDEDGGGASIEALGLERARVPEARAGMVRR